jgi:hypothetical protein
LKRVAKWAWGRPVVGYPVVAVLAASLIGGGWAVAAGTSKALRGCANKRSGALRLAAHCKKSERGVSWSIAGPQGPQGRQGPRGAPGAQDVWSGWLQPAGAARHPQADGHVTTFTFTAPAAGFVDVTASFGVRVHNNGTSDCHVQSQLAGAPGTPSAGPGYMDSWVNANLPTQAGAGTYLQLDASVSRVLPVVAGTNSIYLNGAYDCVDALWGPVSISALFANSNPSATLTAP